MGWKEWSYLLRGGLIAGILGLLIWFLSPLIFEEDFLLVPLCYFRSVGEGGAYCYLLTGHISNFIISFIFGSLIGWIYGKLKEKENINF